MADTRQVLADALDAWYDHVVGKAKSDAMRQTDEKVAFLIGYLSEHNVALVEDDGSHHIDVVSMGTGKWNWTIQHPARCRPDLLSCPMNTQTEDYFAKADAEGVDVPSGRYLLESDGKDAALLDNR